MIPGEIRRYKQSSFPLLSALNDGEQPEQRNQKSSFPKLSVSGGLTGTRLPRIVDKQPLVALSQEDRNLIKGLDYKTNAEELCRERAPGRHHPNRGKRSRGTIDSDLEHKTCYLRGQNSKPLSQQKKRKRRKRVKKENLLDEDEISSLKEISNSDSSDNRRSCAGRRHKSHVRENALSDQAVKGDKKRRIQSCGRSTNSANTKSLSEAKEDLRNPKQASKKADEDVSAKNKDLKPQTDKRWKNLMVRHNKTSTPMWVGNLPSNSWEEECRAANELVFSLKKSKLGSKQQTNNSEERKKAEKSGADNHDTNKDECLRHEKLHKLYKTDNIDYSASYTKFQHRRHFDTDLKKNDRKKVGQFTYFTKEKARKKSAKGYAYGILDTNSRCTMTSDDNEKVSHYSKTVMNKKVQNTKFPNNKSSKVKVNRGMDCDIPAVPFLHKEIRHSTEKHKKGELIEKTRTKSICKKSKNLKVETIDCKENSENAKEVFQSCNSEKKNTVQGVKIYDKDVESQEKKDKPEKQIAQNVNVEVAEENLDLEQKRNRSKTSNASRIPKRLNSIKPLENHSNSSKATTVSKRPLFSKCETSLPTKKCVTKIAMPEPRKEKSAEPTTKGCLPTKEHDTTHAGRKATAKHDYNSYKKTTSKTFQTPEAKSTGNDSATPATKHTTSIPGKMISVQSVSKGGESKSAMNRSILRSRQLAQKHRGDGISGKSVSKIPIASRPKSAKCKLDNAMIKTEKRVSDNLVSVVIKASEKSRNSVPKRPTPKGHGIPVQKKGENVFTHDTDKTTKKRMHNSAMIKRQNLPKPATLSSERSDLAKPASHVSKMSVTKINIAAKSSSQVSKRQHCSLSSETSIVSTVLTERSGSAKCRNPKPGRSAATELSTPVSAVPVSTLKTPTMLKRSTKSDTSRLSAAESERAFSRKSAISGSQSQGSSRLSTPVLERPASVTTSERCVSQKYDTCLPSRKNCTKYANLVSGRVTSGKPKTPFSDTQLKERPSSAITATTKTKTPASAMTAITTSKRSASVMTARRPASAMTGIRVAKRQTSTTEVAVRATSAKPDTQLSQRPTSAMTATKSASARTSTHVFKRKASMIPVAKRPTSATSDTQPTERSFSAMTATTTTKIPASVMTATTKNERPALDITSTTTTKRPTSAITATPVAKSPASAAPVAVRPTSTMTTTTTVDRLASATLVAERPATAKPDSQPIERSSSAMTVTVMTKRPVFDITATTTTKRPASALTATHVAKIPAPATPVVNIATTTKKRPDSAMTANHVIKRPVSAIPVAKRSTSAKPDTRPDERSASVLATTGIPTPKTPASAMITTSVTGKSASTKPDTQPTKRPASVVTAIPTTQRPVSAMTATPVPGKHMFACSSLIGRPASAMLAMGRAEIPVPNMTETKRPASAKPLGYVTTRPTSTEPADILPVSVKVITNVPGRPASARHSKHMSERPARTKPIFPLTERLSASRGSGHISLNNYSALEPQPNRGCEKPEEIKSTRSLTSAMSSASANRDASVMSTTPVSHVTVNSSSISNTSDMSYRIYDDDFEYESAPSRNSLSNTNSDIEYLFD